MKLKIKRLNKDARMPEYAYEGDAGMDIFSCEDCVIKPKERRLIKTGLSCEFEKGYVMLIRDKSGLALKKGITIIAGVVEYTYRGEIGVVMLNNGEEEHKVNIGDKIAQFVFVPVATADVEEVNVLSETQRGENNFGSSGIR